MQGLYIIINTKNDRVYLGSSLNLQSRLKSHRVTLRGNRHANMHLQADWNEFGEDAFSFAVLKEYPNANSTELVLQESKAIQDEQRQIYNIILNPGSYGQAQKTTKYFLRYRARKKELREHTKVATPIKLEKQKCADVLDQRISKLLSNL